MMQLIQHTTPKRLEQYAFRWSLIRLIVSGVSLVSGGTPVIYTIVGYNSILSTLTGTLLGLSWIISGIAAIYLFYRWQQHNYQLFGTRDARDILAFSVAIISGSNLGLAGLFGYNVGLSLNPGGAILLITGILYFITTWHLLMRWESSGKQVFTSDSAAQKKRTSTQ